MCIRDRADGTESEGGCKKKKRGVEYLKFTHLAAAVRGMLVNTENHYLSTTVSNRGNFMDLLFIVNGMLYFHK